jgi:ABC-type glycerol-3-phosphate transport system substrate-binding protein
MRPRIALISGGLILLLLSSFWFTSCSRGPKEDDNTLQIWHWMTDRHDTLLKMGEQYSQETGQKVKFLLNAPSEVYTSKVRAAAATGTLPDVYGVLGESKDLANYVKAGLIFNLTPAMEADNKNGKTGFDLLKPILFK